MASMGLAVPAHYDGISAYQAPQPKLVHLRVDAVIRVLGQSGDEGQKKSVKLTMKPQENFGDLKPRLLEALGLCTGDKKSGAQCNFRYEDNGRDAVVYDSATPGFFGMEVADAGISSSAAPVSRLRANILLSGGAASSSSSASAAPKQDWGPILTFSARTTTSEQAYQIKLGTKQPFSYFVESLRKQISNAPLASQIVLKFDGEKLNLNHTPAKCDMEDEDMIEVSGV
uniref:Rad60/SUMO-like domain-containing protein n=1 Tax=Entomoneis paludosa TaxID=265537 RepID=A0A7S2YHC3_9STRA